MTRPSSPDVRDMLAMAIEVNAINKMTSRFLFDQIELEALNVKTISDCAATLDAAARIAMDLINALDAFEDISQAKPRRPV